MRSPVGWFWSVLYGICCLVSGFLGFRFSGHVLYLLFSASSTTKLASDLSTQPLAQQLPFVSEQITTPLARSKVVVGRHGIRIRPFPHPNPEEVIKAHKLIDRVQEEQRRIYGVKNWRRVIAITPTYVRTFQAVHLTGLMHTLMLVRGELLWIVVEAGGVSNETASLISGSGLDVFHVGYDRQMPFRWGDQRRMQARMRLRGLRVVRERKLDGIVMFCDDSNMHSLELFDEVQSVKWMGALSVGILAPIGQSERWNVATGNNDSPLPVLGPVCNSSGKLVSWHNFNSISGGKDAAVVEGETIFLPGKLEWAGFVVNSRLVWENGDNRYDGKPEWVKDLDEISENDDELESPSSLVRDASFFEPLGKCGQKVLVWWLRAEARPRSKFPSEWIIDPPLEITVPAKRTPWLDPSLDGASMPTERKHRAGDLIPTRKVLKPQRTTSSEKKHRAGDSHVSGASVSQLEKR